MTTNLGVLKQGRLSGLGPGPVRGAKGRVGRHNDALLWRGKGRGGRWWAMGMTRRQGEKKIRSKEMTKTDARSSCKSQ